jgi:STE24 endopeptidase
VPAVFALAGYVFVAFGMLSRRCERQADIYGCRSVAGGGEEGVRTFARALVKVTEMNGVSVRRPGRLASWLHSTTANRVEFLERMLTEPGLEPRFQRRLGLVKWGVLVGLAGLMAALGATAGWDKLLGGM